MMPDRCANVALVFALALVPICGVLALAIDYGQVVWVKSRFNEAADSAALLAATVSANEFRAGGSTYLADGITAGQQRFAAQTGNQTSVVTGQPAAVVKIAQTSGLFLATVSYKAAVPATFANVLGFRSIPISGQSGAQLSFNPYVDVQILMDVSSSMSLAATPADQATMEQLTANYKPPQGVTLPSNVGQGEACAFACHWSAKTDDYYQLALRNNVQLRITVLKSAVGQVLQTMQQQDQDNRFAAGLYTFSNTFNSIYPLSNNISAASASLAQIVPAINDCSGNCDNTDFDNAMNNINSIDNQLPRTGNNIPQKFLFIISDGVYDDTRSGARYIGPFSASDCSALKALNVSILVLYTPYLQIPDNAFWVQHVEPVQDQIQPNLQACASAPSYFFVANDAADIQSQLTAMFQLVVQSSSHLIQ